MKRSIVTTLCMILLVSLFCIPAKASTYSSDYLRSYSGWVSTGNNSGDISLDYNVRARDSVSSIGISSIAVYSADGSYIKSLSGSTANGLLSSGDAHSGTYTISVTPGQNYYLRLTFVARNSNSGDSKQFTTNTATAAR